MPLIEITPHSVLMFMANKSEDDVFVTTPEELREFAHCVENQRGLYRCEDFSNFDSLNCFLNMKDWAPMMFDITYQGKEDRWQWDKIKVRKRHKNWDYMYNRYTMTSELEYFEKAYEEYLKSKIKDDMTQEMKEVKLLEEQLQELQQERSALHKKEENIKLEYQVLNNKEQEIQEEIDKIKSNGVSNYLGKFARIITDSSKSIPYYIYITSVNTKGSYSLASFGGPGFYLNDESYLKWVRIQYEHKSAFDESFVSITDHTQVEFITKEEFFEAFDKFQQEVKEKMISAVDAIPRKKTKFEWKYDEEMYDVKEL